MSSGPPDRNSLPVEESCGDADSSNSLTVVEETDLQSSARETPSHERNGDHSLDRNPGPTGRSTNGTCHHCPMFPELSGGEARVHTLQWFPVSQSLRCRFADAGLFSDGYGNYVRCFHCGIMVGNWSENDNPLQEHREYSPNCAFIRQLEDEQRDNSLRVRETRTPEPVFGVFESYARRWKSFQGRWPKEDVVTTDSLARCGLFYRGNGDTVVCFHCGGRLSRWERGDNPEMEHRRLYPHCPNSSAQAQASGSEILSRSEAEMLFSLFSERGFSCRQIWEGMDAFISRFPGERITAEGLGTVLMDEEPEENISIPEPNLVYSRNGAQDVDPDRQRRGDNLEQDFLNAMLHHDTVRNGEIVTYYPQASQQPGAPGREECGSLDEEQQLALNRQLKKKMQCWICKERNFDMVFLPCRHLVCEGCAHGKVSCNCGSPIETKTKVFM